jgi:carbon-monoxide dehydrogenase medium subunit
MQNTGMNGPAYIAPESIEDALSIKSEHGAHARIIVGGTDLILRMKDKVLSPGLLIDLSRVSLDSITSHAGELRLGACVTQSQILADTRIASTYPALLEACREFAGPPIRNRGTLGGNLVNASPAADLVPPLLAYDASLVLASSSSIRVLPVTEFLTGPGQTAMEADEILTEIRLPAMPPHTVSRFTKLGQRRSMAISIVNLTTRLTLDEASQISDARIVLGAVAPTVIRAFAAEALLIGKQPSSDLLARVAREASRETSPITDVRASKDYRLKMAEVLVRRALEANWDDLRRAGLNG